MINPVSNIQVETILSSTGETLCRFRFDNTEVAIGGYRLYLSTDGINYSALSSRIDSIHMRAYEESTYKENDKAVYEQLFSLQYANTYLYVYFVSISIILEESIPSEVVEFSTFPLAITNLQGTYDGTTITLTWDDSSSDNSYVISYHSTTQVDNFQWNSQHTVLYYDGFYEHDFIWVYDRQYRSHWWGFVTTEGEFNLEENKKTEISDNADDYQLSIDNLLVRKISPNGIIISTVLTKTFSYPISSYGDYVFSVTTKNTYDQTSRQSFYPIICQNFFEVIPILRLLGNSNDEFLNVLGWKNIRRCLVDKNYYDLSTWTLPYVQDLAYHLKGYVGISNCLVDVYINDIYSFTTSTGAFGDFNFYYTFNYGVTSVRFVARTSDNLKISKSSRTYNISLKNVYTHFALVAKTLRDILSNIEMLKKEISYQEQKYLTYFDRYAPLLNIYKYADEDYTKFLNLTYAYYQALRSSMYDEACIGVLDAFVENVDQFDHYEIYSNSDLYGILDTKTSFAPEPVIGLERDDYYYGIASCTNSGAITTPTLLRVDSRWWPDGFRGINVLMWDEAVSADYYMLYKGYSEDALGYVVSTDRNIWVDTGELPIDYNITPKDMNFTVLNPPLNFRKNNNIYLTSVLQWLKRNTQLIIIIYGKGNSTIPEFQINRLRLMLQTLIPTEFKYYLLYANDTQTTIYSGVL